MLIDFLRVVPRKRKVKIVGKSGVIYHNPSRMGHVVFYIANVSLILASIYLLYLYYPLGKALFMYERSKTTASLEQEVAVEAEKPENVNVYTITIPKILAFSEVVENVSPFNTQEYLRVLENDLVAQAKNTDTPGGGVGKTTYIFAHSTQQGFGIVRNNSVFYLLGQLKNGDKVTLQKDGIGYIYKVYQQKIVNANQVEFLEYSDPEKEVVILQTCWPIGTDWKRLLVFAERVDGL